MTVKDKNAAAKARVLTVYISIHATALLDLGEKTAAKSIIAMERHAVEMGIAKMEDLRNTYAIVILDSLEQIVK